MAELLTLTQFVGDVDGDDFRVVVRLELEALLLILSLQLVIVGQLAIVNDGDVWKRVRPERMRMRNIDLALSGEPDVSKTVSSVHLREMVLLIQLVGIANVLDNLRRPSDAVDLSSLDGENRVGQLSQVPRVIQSNPVELAKVVNEANGAP